MSGAVPVLSTTIDSKRKFEELALDFVFIHNLKRLNRFNPV